MTENVRKRQHRYDSMDIHLGLCPAGLRSVLVEGNATKQALPSHGVPVTTQSSWGLTTVTACRQVAVTNPRKQQPDTSSERLLEIQF